MVKNIIIIILLFITLGISSVLYIDLKEYNRYSTYKEILYMKNWSYSTEGISKAAKNAISISENTTCPNNNFSHVIHFPKEWKKDYTGTPGKYPQTCMNTVSAFYNPKANWAQCQYFVNNCTKLGFKETTTPKAGDIIIFFKKNHAFHTGLYLGESRYGPVINHSNGGKLPSDYQKHILVKNLYKNCGEHVYYRYYTYIK